MLVSLLTVVIFFAALVLLVKLAVTMVVNVALWGGIGLTLLWLGGMAFIGARLKRLANAHALFRPLALAYDHTAFYTLLLQGIMFSALTLAAIGMMVSDTPPQDSNEFVFGLIIIVTWIAALIFGLGLGIGGPLKLLEHLPSETWRKRLYTPVVLLGFCAGSGVAVAVPSLVEKPLALLRDQHSLGVAFWLVMGILALLSAVAMRALFGDVVKNRQYYM